MDNKIEDLNLQDVLFILRKHIKIIIAAALVCCAIGFIISKFFMQRQYQAEAKLIVNTSSSATNASEVYNAVELSQKEVDTYAIIIENNTVLDGIIKDLKLNITKDDLAKKIDVSAVGTTEVIDIKVKDTNPDTAKAIENDIIKLAPAEIVRTVNAGSVEVVSSPEVSGNPVSPNVRLITAASALAGLIIAVLIAFLMEMLNNTFSSDDDVQKHLGFNVIGVIPSLGDGGKM